MKKRTFLLALASSAMLLASGLTPNFFSKIDFGGADNANYEEEYLVNDFDKPAEYEVAPIKRASSSASCFKLHYHNDDGANKTREVWVWCPGLNGSAFAPVVSADGKDMTLTIDFTQEQYKGFANKKSISFIVKYKDGWTGQSENVEIKYSEYAPSDTGVTEIWCIPGEGNAIEIYKSEAETKVDRYQLATFKDWKTIEVIATDTPQSYRLYALTSNYMRMGTIEQKEKLQNYLVAEGSNPQSTTVEYNSLPCKKFTINLNYTIRPNVQYYLEGEFPKTPQYTKTKYVSFHELYNTARFERYYNYEGNDLGATYNADGSTTFKVWAPTAARVRVLIYEVGTSEELAAELKEKGQDVKGSDTARGFNMSFRPGGIWETTIKNRDLKNWYYNYSVVNSLGTSVATDPYAKACGVNGDRGMIVDWKETNPEGWNNLPVKWDGDATLDIKTPNELSIYETHIRDISMDSSWNGKQMRGTYSAFIESGTTLSDGTTKTGYDHLKRLGVTAIQLEPVFDHDNNEEIGNRVQNWGYNPKNYNCVEGSYATDPYDGAARIKEFKTMIQTFANNENHTRFIMDVVYNHVSSAPGSCFNKLMPKYYFRYVQEGREGAGNYYDGSGCGNEVRTEAPMMRKYVVDSLCWWASEYKIKGFRFDLMGLIDVGTIDAARRALYNVDPDIYLYGEGWTGDGSGYDYGKGEAYQVHGNQDLHDDGTASHNNLTPEQIKLLGCVRSSVYRYLYPVEGACLVGSFNDSGRNALRGENNAGSTGYLSGNTGDENGKKVADMMVGYQTGYGGNPLQCVNYGSCHDNFTLFDQFSLVDATSDTGMACAATAAAECAILFSNGVAFIHGGEETFRSKVIRTPEDLALAKESDYAVKGGKKISHNSYNLSDDVNAYKWDRLKKVDGVDVTGYVEAIMKAVALRKTLKKYTSEDLEKWSGTTPVKHPYREGSPFNVWTNTGRDEAGWPNWEGVTAIGIYNSNGTNGVTCLLTSLSSTTAPGGSPSRLIFNSNPKAVVSYNDGNVKMGAASCIAYQ